MIKFVYFSFFNTMEELRRLLHYAFKGNTKGGTNNKNV